MRAILFSCVKKNINIILSSVNRNYSSSPCGKQVYSPPNVKWLPKPVDACNTRVGKLSKLSKLLSSTRCEAHMNELPVPAGPWGPWYKKKQRFYTSWLIVGIVWWVFSLLMAINSGCFYLNWGPPLQPAPPSDMIDDCD